jgi:hypothetical protein
MWDNDEMANKSEAERELHAILVFARSLKGKVIIVEVDRTDNALVHQVDNGIQQRQTKNTDENLLEPEKKKNVVRTGQSCLFMSMRVQAVEIHRAIQTSCTPPSCRASQSRIRRFTRGHLALSTVKI